ncbi:MAG: HU family DNA-binding protein [Pseudomonadales bacterium]|nr:HU family DNA-binding protein [Pseudomonadales bacterium]MCP5320474.1 HU family DNA-binding protein [Pseudomonadales bacterium]MCP5336768.1 HU family DNA-binding protein [Pseudomonadales bacterium]
MNKAELVDLIADKADISKASAARVLDATLEGIVAALRDGDQVALVGFGTFSVKQRAERQGRNPKTGEAMTIAASRSVGFKPGKTLRDAIS